ncbi:MAG: hypothetical protein GEV13_27595 [Rhodospirillales bacterium]|nr:hypothetical protein [Rhodospirillales bacterium]
MPSLAKALLIYCGTTWDAITGKRAQWRRGPADFASSRQSTFRQIAQEGAVVTVAAIKSS